MLSTQAITEVVALKACAHFLCKFWSGKLSDKTKVITLRSEQKYKRLSTVKLMPVSSAKNRLLTSDNRLECWPFGRRKKTGNSIENQMVHAVPSSEKLRKSWKYSDYPHCILIISWYDIKLWGKSATAEAIDLSCITLQ